MSMKQKLTKTWFYFRTGYSYYFVFLVSGLNALMIAYFVVILGTTCDAGKSLTEQGDVLCLIRFAFPHFGYFVLFSIAVGVPTMTVIGWWHYTRHQLGTHAHVEWKSNPYYYQVIGHQKLMFEILKELMKEIQQQNKFDQSKVDRLEKLQKQIDFLLDGGKLK